MRQTLGHVKHFLPGIVLLAALAGISPVATGQTATVTYDLDNVWLDPDVSHPWEPSQQMTGTFVWTYDIGDFENGTGQFTVLNIPWYNPGLADLNTTIDLTSIEITLVGNYHDRGIDITLFLLTPLSPNQSSTIDTVMSKFEIQYGVTYEGHVVSGNIVPDIALGLTLGGTCPANLLFTVDRATPNGQVALLYAYGTGSFVIPGGFPCAGTTLGLNNTVALGAMITAGPDGVAALNTSVPPAACGNFFIQALDIATCGTSNVVLLE